MGAIGLNPIRLDRIGLDPIRINAIKLGVPGASGSDRPYIDPEVLASLKAVCICYGKSNDDPDRAVVKNLVDPDNPFVISNAAYTEGSGYADKGSPYYGAFVTDGIDDLITSTKSVTEMLDGSNEVTVVSMIHQVKDSANNVSFTNYIRGSANGYFRNIVNNYDKTGIYGYTSSDLKGLSVVNNILGDKNDYTSNGDNRDSIINGNFSVQGYSYNDGNNTGDFSSVAWYWTIIANKVLTTDQINQVIAYFNLDRTLKPDILCDVKKQGITNDNHAEFGDKLIDFSGNGRDIQLNNVAWEGESGIIDGALYLDGISDFGKVTGLPIYKDYTVVADYVRTFAKENAQDAPILSKSQVAGDGAFLFNYLNVNSVISSYSFGTNNVLTNVSDSERKIYYQSKYVNGGKSINSGTGTDYDSMWLGTYRDDSQIFFTGAIYSLMSFPYSLSEFLIERQLKKHKLGTLYPDMVEWRPIVKSNVPYKNIVYTILGTSTQLVVGQHYPVSTKVRMTINTIGKVDEVSLVTINGQEAEISRLVLADFVLTSKSPQKIDITIDEYIRYEDIVQPYPDMIDLKQDNKNITWGDKLKVGSEIIYYNNYNSNPLSKLYNLGTVLHNGNVIYNGNIIEVKKDMVFTSKSKWKLDNNEPKCILSPSRLRIPNSSYKILGYIPDISGHGNHGKINNSAYAGMSGANGYVENFTTWGVYNGAISTDNTIKTNSNFNPADSWIAYKGANTILNSFSVNITGIPEGGILNFRVNADTFIELSNGRNDLSFDNIPVTVSSGFRITKGSNLDWSNLVIQQIGKYEGAYCLDGVDDFITIPTTVGGKQVLMKVNWQSSIAQGMLYDQRGYANEFAIWNSNFLNDNEDGVLPAYSARNNGQTYIDGILNNNIKASELRAITHNITITNELSSGVNNTYPVIGANKTVNAYFANMSLYDFMLFDEISTDEEILTLNEYVGIEGNTDDLFTENN